MAVMAGEDIGQPLLRQHLQRREPPPPIVDELIGITYRAVIADYRARRRR